MKTKKWTLVLCIIIGVLVVSCNKQTPKVAPLRIDLPASYKSDSAAYHFIMNQVDVWNTFGKKVESMHRKGEKFRKKEFNSLSPKQLHRLVKLDYDYAVLWITQDIYLDQMLLEGQLAMSASSEQGMGKIIETQKLISEYYVKLALNFSKDLQLDKEPATSYYIDSLKRSINDSIDRARIDSIYQKLLPPDIQKIK